MTTREKLGWGAAHLVPENAPAAWGARLIVTQTGDVDIVGDRQHAVGAEDDIDILLNRLGNEPWLQSLSDMLINGIVSTREGLDVTVYEDAYIMVRGNSNGSAGYFYIAAWLK
jgi:hypothetical protein